MNNYYRGYISLFPLLFLASLLPLIFLLHQQDLSFYRTIVGQRIQAVKQQQLFYQAINQAKKNPKLVCQQIGKNPLNYQGKDTGYFVQCEIASKDKDKDTTTNTLRLVKGGISDF